MDGMDGMDDAATRQCVLSFYKKARHFSGALFLRPRAFSV